MHMCISMHGQQTGGIKIKQTAGNFSNTFVLWKFKKVSLIIPQFSIATDYSYSVYWSAA